MANEEESKQLISISDSSQNFEDMSEFYLKETFSDVTLLVDGKEIVAHKVILAKRSKYFKSMLLTDPKQTVFTIKDVSSEVFKQILKYIYTGSISIVPSNEDLVVDVLKFSHFYILSALEKTISEKMASVLNVSNVWSILNKANFYDLESLREICHTYIDDHILEVLKIDSFTVLTEKSMMKLLERDNLPLPEIEVFNMVTRWCKVNRVNNGSVVQCIRLTLLTRNEILSVVRPSKLIESDKLLNVLATIEDGSAQKRERRKPLMKNSTLKYKRRARRVIKNENLAMEKYGAKVISGMNTGRLLRDSKLPEQLPTIEQIFLAKCTYHGIGDNTDITVDLGYLSAFNHIALELKNSNIFRYYVELSVDNQSWYKIIDYSKYDCRGCQTLYFPEEVARYIRIIRTYSSEKWIFELRNLEVYFKDEIPEVRNHVICPTENVAAVNEGAVVFGGHNKDYLLANDNINNRYYDVYSGSTTFAYLSCGNDNFIIQLRQPCMISQISFEVQGCNKNYNMRYGCIIETSVNNNDWSIVKKHTFSLPYGRQQYEKLSFPERLVVYIKITNDPNYSAVNERFFFFCRKFQCWTDTQKNIKQCSQAIELSDSEE